MAGINLRHSRSTYSREYIFYDKDLLANCPLTASLSNQHLYEKLDLICQALEVNYEIINGVIVIKGNGGCNKQIVN